MFSRPPAVSSSLTGSETVWPLVSLIESCAGSTAAHIRLYRTDELTTMLGGAGFSDIVVSTLYDGGYAIIQSRRV